MNILPFVTILILVISLTISSFFGGYKESSYAKIGSTGLISAFRLARNSAEETRLLNYAKTLTPETQETAEKPEKPEKKQAPPKVRKNREKSFRENITENSKFNLAPLLKEDDPFLEDVFTKLLIEIYQNTDLAIDYKYDKKELPKLLVKEILLSARKGSFAEPIEFEMIVLPNKGLHEIWYKMLKGSPNYPDKASWPPISRFVILKEIKDKKVVAAKKASIPLLKAFFGNDITTAILEKEKEGVLTKTEMDTFLETLGVDPIKKNYLHYGYSKKLRRTESEKDPTTGITATLSYSTQK